MCLLRSRFTLCRPPTGPDGAFFLDWLKSLPVTVIDLMRPNVDLMSPI